MKISWELVVGIAVGMTICLLMSVGGQAQCERTTHAKNCIRIWIPAKAGEI